MKSSIYLIGTIAVLACLVMPCLMSHHGSSKSQSIDAKEQSFSHKKSGLNRNNKHDYYARYQDWDEDWSNEDMMQHPIDESPRKSNRPLGEMCSYSTDCAAGCCLLDRETKIRSCQRKAKRGEKCTSAQVKGDLYVDACPCSSGDDFCAYPGEFCTA